MYMHAHVVVISTKTDISGSEMLNTWPLTMFTCTWIG